jgi:superfamily II DNA or RNA helicase
MDGTIVSGAMAGVKLRSYQDDLVQRVRAEFGARKRRVLAVSPTGSGKTVVLTYIALGASSRGNTVTIVAHRQEIVDQISRALDAFGVQHGLIMPGRTHTDDPVQVAMIQTVGRRLDRMAAPTLMVVDEAHHSPSKTYLEILDRWSSAKVLGVTATPERLDGRGLGDVFDAMVIGPSVRSLIGSGHLAAFDYFAPPPIADISGVGTAMGDYKIGDLADAMDRATITGDAVDHYRDHLGGRPALAFCVTVAHAEHVAETFRAAGYRAASVDGAMDRTTRRDRIAALADGRLNVLTSCDVVSEGTDIPVCAGAILLRPTRSLSMFLQQVGRALRPKSDGSRAVILDHVGNVERFGMPDDPRAWTLDGRAKRHTAASICQCKKCYQIFPAGQAVDCGAACDDCPMKREGGGEPIAPPECVGGRLTKREDPLAWAGGIDLALASGAEWRALLERAGGKVDRLKMIARSRGYKRGWPQHAAKDFIQSRA